MNTKTVLMLVVLSAGMLTALTETGVSQVKPAFAETDDCKDNKDNNCNEDNNNVKQENKCKIENEEIKDSENSGNNNDNDLSCLNIAQNPKGDLTNNDNAFDNLNSQ